jgi:hypothetical protein
LLDEGSAFGVTEWSSRKWTVLVDCTAVGRANQFNSGGGIFPVTHRCHNRAFLLKFACDRELYRSILREQLEEFEVWLLEEAALNDAIARGEGKREAIWTESLAVGSAGFVERIKPMVLTRRETEVVEMEGGVSVLQECPGPYGQKTSPKNAA